MNMKYQKLIIKLKLINTNIRRFADGEIYIEINENIRGNSVFVIQSTSNPANDNLMELLLVIDALRRSSAKNITAVIPYFGYARQDRKPGPRTPITAKLVANLLTTSGADRVLTIDLHAGQIQGFFDIPIDNFRAMPILVQYFKSKNFDDRDLVIVSPDHGGAVRARNMGESMNAPIAIIDKRRPKANVAEVMGIVGDVAGKTAIIIDDMIDTAGTITAASKALMEAGAKEVYACCTHPLLSKPAIDRINNSPLIEVVCTNTIQLPIHKKSPKIVQLSVASLFAKGLLNVMYDRPLSSLFVYEGKELK